MGAPHVLSLFKDSKEYEQRKKTPFRPPQITLADLHAAIPKHLFEKSTFISLQYVARSIVLVFVFYHLALLVDNWTNAHPAALGHGVWTLIAKSIFWPTYWLFQGLAFTGFWCISHEAGHGTLSPHPWVNHVVGYILHTFLLVPYYAWRATHHAHHKAAGSVERDENYVPRTRRDYNLPPPENCHPIDYRELFEDTPAYVLGRMFLMQMLGWHSYLLFNTLGSPSYPPGTNHFSPSSPLFKREPKSRIIVSNIGVAAMVMLLAFWGCNVGLNSFAKCYLVPYLLTNHWIVMLTFLHHTDPTIPHYRGKEWTWLRGALATVDRPLLGPLGRFFLHNVSHDHIAHHLFSQIPFYNQPQVTEILKRALQDDYNFDSTNSFRALYRSFTECCFIEDDEGIAFYKNSDGEAQRSLAAI